jgi:hypothetical protein
MVWRRMDLFNAIEEWGKEHEKGVTRAALLLNPLSFDALFLNAVTYRI